MIIEKFADIVKRLQNDKVGRTFKHDLGPIAIELLKLEIAEEKEMKKEEKKEEKKSKK